MSMPPFRKNHGSLASGQPHRRFPRIRKILTATGIFLGAFLLGGLLSFPGDALKQRVLNEIDARGQIDLELADITVSPLLKLHGEGAILRSKSPHVPPVQIDALTLSPIWFSVFSSNPGIRLTCRLLGGDLMADMYHDGMLDLVANNLMLDLPIAQVPGLRVAGRADQIHISSNLPLKKATKSSVKIFISGLQLAQIPGLQNNLDLGNTRLTAIGQGTSFKLTELTTAGGDFDLEGRGNILLGRSVSDSRVNLRTTIRPTQGADASLVELLNAFVRKKADNTFEVRLSGNLANPSFK